MKIIDRVRKSTELGRQAWRYGGDSDLILARGSELSAQLEAFEARLTESTSAITALETEVMEYRQLGGGRHDMQEWDHDRMLKVALHLYRRDHMARRLMNIIVDFVIGDGISVQAKAEGEGGQDAIQGVIDQFWNDPVNQMDRALEDWCTGWNLWGEICLPVQRNETDGMIRLGWIDSETIGKVINDPFTQRPAALEMADSYVAAVGAKTIAVSRYDDVAKEWVGDCFFRTMNTVVGQSRGVSEIYTSADWFDVLDQTMKYQADRVKIMNAFIWDVKLTGMNEDAIRAWVQAHGSAPKPNTIRAHNENVEWQAIAPNLNSYESANHAKLLRTHILGGWGYPNHWFGDGGDANLATAAVMNEPTRKALRRKQRQFRWLIQDIVRYLLSSSQKAGTLPASMDLSVDQFTVQIPDFSGPDIAKVGAAVAQVTAAITAAEQQGYISHDTAVELFASVASETGFDIDPAAERKKIEEDVKQQLKDEHAREVEQEEELRTRVGAASKDQGEGEEADGKPAFAAGR